MYTFDLQSKLKKLNPKIYVDTRRAWAVNEEFAVVGIYLKTPKRRRQTFTSGQMHYASSEQRGILQASERGEKDQHIGGCDRRFVPEYDIFDVESGEVLAEGWRTIVCSLAKRGLIDLSKARRVFNSSSLGEHDYDKLSLYDKIEASRKQNGNRH